MNLRCPPVGENRVDLSLRVGVQGFHLGALGDITLQTSIAAIDGGGLEQLIRIAERPLVADAGVDQAGKNPQVPAGKALTFEVLIKMAAIFQGGGILDRHDHPVGGIQSVAGEDVEVRASINDDDSGEASLSQRPGQGVIPLQLVADGAEMLAGGDELDAVFAHLHQAVRALAGEQIEDVAALRQPPSDAEHSVDGEVIVEAEQGYRQFLPDRLQVDGQVGGQGGFPDPAFFAGDSHNIGLRHVILPSCQKGHI